MRQMKAIVMWMGVAALFAAAPSRVAAQTIVEHYHLDPIGSVRAVTDSNGSVVRRHDYQPFGEEAVPCTATAGADAQRFAGKIRDWESCLDHFEARQYRNVLGRFTSVDPIMATTSALTDPQLWNRYSYARVTRCDTSTLTVDASGICVLPRPRQPLQS
jgi:RHS repeat-associated protein